MKAFILTLTQVSPAHSSKLCPFTFDSNEIASYRHLVWLKPLFNEMSCFCQNLLNLVQIVLKNTF